MTERGVTITLPMLPNRKLAHNAARGKSGWRLSPMTKSDRETARWLTMDQPWRNGADEWETITDPVTVSVYIHWDRSQTYKQDPTRLREDRRMDWDSLTTLIKPMIDGIVDAGVLANDRQIQSGIVYQDVDPDGTGFVTIRIEPAA